MRDVAVDMILRRARRIMRRAFGTGDGTPGIKRTAIVPQRRCMGPRLVELFDAIGEQVARLVRRLQCQHGKHECLGLPEIMPFISLARQALRSEERREGKECVSTCRSRWPPYH